MKRVFKDTTIITMNSNRECYQDGGLVVEDATISKVGRVCPEDLATADEVISLPGRVILPGLVNTHVHTSQQLARGLGDDVSVFTWFYNRIWPFESHMTEEDSYISTLLSACELIRSGVSTFAEAGGQYINGMGKAVTQAGIRGILTRSVMDIGEGPMKMLDPVEKLMASQEEMLDLWHNQANGRIKVWFALRTLLNNSEKLVLKTFQLAEKHGVGVHMHLSEILEEVEVIRKRAGFSPVGYLAQLGALVPYLLAVHAVWLSEEDINLLATHDVKVSHNPAAALRVLGFPKVTEMMARGICVGLGTDGAPSNNRMNILDEMWLTTLLHKGRLHDPMAMPAETVLQMATIDGARCLHWENEIGSLEKGKKADFVVLNPNTVGMMPVHDLVSNIVNSMHSDNVESLVVDGLFVLKEGKILTIAEDDVIKESGERARAIAKRAEIHLTPRFPLC